MTDATPAPLDPAPAPEKLTPVVANRAILVYLLSSLVVQTLVIAVLKLGTGVALLAGGLVTLAFLAVLFPAAWRELRASPFWRQPPDWLVAFGAFGLGFVASRAITVFMQSVFPASADALQDYNLGLISGGWDLWVLLFAGGLFIPFVEELIFRGFGLTAYSRRLGLWGGALATSVLFALVHFVPAQIVAVFPLGLVIARAVQHTGRFWTGVVVHALNNTLSLGAAALLLTNPALKPLVEASTEAGARVPLAAGLFALVLGLVALGGALAWLRPRVPEERRPGPVWSWSLAVPLVLFVLTLFGQRLGDVVRDVVPGG